jgi:hypothetical protein
MKKITYFLSLGAILLSTAIIFSACKKKSETIVPSFTVSATTVELVGGQAGLTFYAKCNNDDVKMTKVTITDPLAQQTTTYNLNSNTYVNGELFGLQADGTGYIKELGTWSFNFVGNRTADGSSFAVTNTLSVTGK